MKWNQRHKKTGCIFIVGLTLFAHAISSSATSIIPYTSYTYSIAGGSVQAIPCPAPFLPTENINGSIIGTDLASPQDMVIDASGDIYLVDAGTNQILVMDSSFKLKNLFGPKIMMPDGKESALKGPSGIAITKNGDIYIADTENARIVVLSSKGKVVKVLDAPVVDTFGQNYKYTPIKLAVDTTNRIYVVSRTDNMGIIELDSEGGFVGYIGSNKAIVDPIELLWKKLFYSKEQNEKSIQAIPVEYSNLSLDDRGFIYAVSSAKLESTPIKRLNPSGKDVLRREGVTKTVEGDLVLKSADASVMVDIVGAGNEVFYTLDKAKGRVFCYNSDGYLLFVFGALGNQFGCFKTPVAIEYANEKLYVLDSSLKSITVFETTPYSKAIIRGDLQYYNGQYEESVSSWEEVLKYNSNFELAYAQIGRVLLRQGNYSKAMEYFELGNMRGGQVLQDSGYNKALAEYRKQVLQNNLGMILTIAAVITAIIISLSIFLKKRKKSMMANSGNTVWEGVEE